MLKFFTDKKWWPWSIGGTIVIVAAVYTIVRLDVMINEWFGAFYDLLQKALSAPNAVSLGEFNSQLITFFTIAGVYVIINTVFNRLLGESLDFSLETKYGRILSCQLGESA